MKHSTACLAAALALALALAGCAKKRSGSSSGGSLNFAAYAGTWTMTCTPTAATGTCGPLRVPRPSHPVTIDSEGRWASQDGASVGAFGSDGVMRFAITNPLGCGNGSGSGTCDSLSHCHGTFSQSGGAEGSETDSWVIDR